VIKNQSIKTITLKTLLTVILIAALVMIVLIGASFRSLSKKIVINQAVASSEIIKAGLTSHMKSNTMDKRDYFLSEIKSLHNIKRIELIRSPEVDAQYGKGMRVERAMTAQTQKVFESGTSVFQLKEFESSPAIRALIPFAATKSGELNCMQCHTVPEGTVLGVVDIEIDITRYRNLSLAVLAVALLIALILVLMIVINTFHTISIYIQEPLESLIAKAKEAYLRREPLDESGFDSLEFQNVAHEINLFNADIVKTQKLLEEKNKELLNLNTEIDKTLKETVFTMVTIEEKRSKETGNHTRRVSEYCRLIATHLGMEPGEVDLVADASPLHDIGKIGISDYILLMNGPLTKDEFKIMKNHANIGYEMLKHSHRDILRVAAIIAYQHHERWDGGGYPRGLKGDDIHIYGRIVAVADVFDALATVRSYKKAWSLDAIKEEFQKQSGRHFDPRIIRIFFDNIEGFLGIHKTYCAPTEEDGEGHETKNVGAWI